MDFENMKRVPMEKRMVAVFHLGRMDRDEMAQLFEQLAKMASPYTSLNYFKMQMIDMVLKRDKDWAKNHLKLKEYVHNYENSDDFASALLLSTIEGFWYLQTLEQSRRFVPARKEATEVIQGMIANQMSGERYFSNACKHPSDVSPSHCRRCEFIKRAKGVIEILDAANQEVERDSHG